MDASTLEQYTGKRVVLTRNLKEKNEKGESAVEIEGTIEVANALGVMFKPKGRTNLELVEIGEIEEIALAPERDRKIKARVLQLVTLGGARNHLLERHGMTLTKVNGLTEEEALELHSGIDHEKSDLGHVHAAKTKTDAEAAVEASDEG